MIIITLLYFWMIVLTIGLFLIWTKLEIITERINEESQYQKLINTETTKEIVELIKELKLTQKHQEKPESTLPMGLTLSFLNTINN